MQPSHRQSLSTALHSRYSSIAHEGHSASYFRTALSAGKRFTVFFVISNLLRTCFVKILRCSRFPLNPCSQGIETQPVIICNDFSVYLGNPSSIDARWKFSTNDRFKELGITHSGNTKALNNRLRRICRF